jgi:hypothetical protein
MQFRTTVEILGAGLVCALLFTFSAAATGASENHLSNEAQGAAKSAQRKPPVTGEFKGEKGTDKTDDAIVVDVTPMKVGRRSLSLKQGEESNVAFTKWIFHLYPQITYDPLEKRQTAKGLMVKLKVTGVTANISLLVSISISPKADKRTIDHENGHVKICAKVYSTADKAARLAAETILGKTYEGLGKDEDAASRDALSKAAAELTSLYRARTVEYADRISKFYDEIDQKRHLSIDEEVRLAEGRAAKDSLAKRAKKSPRR